MSTTTKYGFKNMGQDDFYNIDDQNYNWNKAEQVLDAIEGNISGIKIPVTSVNSKTGSVVLSATDVGAAPKTHGHSATEIIIGNNKTLEELIKEGEFKTLVIDKPVTYTSEVTDGGLFNLKELRGNTFQNLSLATSRSVGIDSNNSLIATYITEVTMNKVGSTYTYINLANKPINVTIHKISDNSYKSSILVQPYGKRVITLTNDEKIYALVGNITTQGWTNTDADKQLLQRSLLIFEGDYTTKQTPTAHFEGIKSVGEIDTISYTSRSKNLVVLSDLAIRNDGSSVTGVNNFEVNYATGTIKFNTTGDYQGISNNAFLQLEPNTQYTMSLKGNRTRMAMQNSLGVFPPGTGTQITSNNKVVQTFTTDNIGLYRFVIENGPNGAGASTASEIMIYKGTDLTQPYIRGDKDTLLIPLSEPMRSIPNYATDSLGLANFGQVTLTGQETSGIGGFISSWDYREPYSSDTVSCFAVGNSQMKMSTAGQCLCNNFLPNSVIDNSSIEMCYVGSWGSSDGSIFIKISNAKIGVISTDDKSTKETKFKTWLSNNPTTVMYVKKTPTVRAVPQNWIRGFKEGTLFFNSIIPTNSYFSYPVGVDKAVVSISEVLPDLIPRALYNQTLLARNWIEAPGTGIFINKVTHSFIKGTEFVDVYFYDPESAEGVYIARTFPGRFEVYSRVKIEQNLLYDVKFEGGR